MTALENIGPKQVRLRVMSGAGGLLAGIAAGIVLVWRGEPRTWRLGLFLPFFVAGLGFFQAKARVCVAHAGQGTCNMDAGAAPLDDPDRVAALRRVAGSIYVSAALFAAILTAGAYLWPA